LALDGSWEAVEEGLDKQLLDPVSYSMVALKSPVLEGNLNGISGALVVCQFHHLVCSQREVEEEKVVAY
jgi:hypothetical protein